MKFFSLESCEKFPKLVPFLHQEELLTARLQEHTPRYAESGLIEIDNTLMENGIRPTAIGKKNWLFIGDANTGQRSAIIYTLIESCRRRGIDPQAYPRDVLTGLPGATNQQIPRFTPARWAEARNGKLPKAA